MSKKGFTLIELLVVVAIIGILASVVLASLTSARTQASIAAGKQFEANLYHEAGDQAVGMWDLDECAGGAGATVADSTGYGNTGILSTPPPTWSSTNTPLGKGCALVFNGTSTYVAVTRGAGTKINFSSYNPFTISEWVYLTDNTTPHPFFGFGNPYNANGTGLISSYGYPSAGRSNVCLDSGVLSGICVDFTAASSIPLNTWTYVAEIFTNTSATLYLNGKMISSQDISSMGISNLGTSDFNIGAYGASPLSQIWQGSIDQVKIYAKGLTAQEIRDLYAEGLINHNLAEK